MVGRERAWRSAEALRDPRWQYETDFVRSLLKNYFAVTSEWVIAWTDSAMRFCTPTLRISLAT